MTPEPIGDDASGAAPTPPLPPPESPRWFRSLSSFLFVVFCFELGLFLLVYPWTESWTDNYFSVAVPDRALMVWREWWNNTYVRGGVSGLGLVNVWIALAEILSLFSGRKRPPVPRRPPAPRRDA